MIISYFIGRKAGRPFINKFGKWVGLKEKRMEKVDRWMKKYGPYTIILGYFIPGIRHVTCYFSESAEWNSKPTYASPPSERFYGVLFLLL